MKKLFLLLTLITFGLGLFAQTATAPTNGDGASGTPYQIATWENLYWISQNPSSWDKHFIQTADINFAIATPAITTWASNTGWTPIGTEVNPFTGTYDGQGNLIENIYINRPTSDLQGLFGAMVGANTNNKAILRNIKISGVDITALGRAGSLLGKVDDNHHTLIENCYAVNGTVRGQFTTGGLVGANNGTQNGPPASNQTLLQYCFADIDVVFTGDGTSGIDIKIGGLVGCGQRGTIRNSYAMGSVNGTNGATDAQRVGGLAGCIIQGSITNSFAVGMVTGGTTYVGPLVGRSAGLGASDGITNTFFNADSANADHNTLGTSKTTLDLQTLSTFTTVGWDFDNIWALDAGINNGYPYLLSNPPSGNTPTPIVEKEFDGDTDNNWDEPNNWSTDATPTASSITTIPVSKSVVIPAGYAAEVIDLYIKPNASLTINSTGSLTVGGNLYIHADANGTGSFIDNGNLTVSGQVFVQKYIAEGDFGATVSSSVNIANTDVFNGHINTYYYNPLAPEWATFSSGNMDVARGYWTKFSNNKTLEFSGTPNSGEIVYNELYRTIAYGEGNMGWNFLGNPYPSAVDWQEIETLNRNGGTGTFTDSTKINSSVYISDNDGGYLSFVAGTGQIGFLEGYIPSHTAFWVQVNKDAGFNDSDPITGAKLKLDNSVRLHQDQSGSKSSQESGVLRLQLSNNNHSNEAIIRLRSGATMDFDPAYDAVKMFSNNASHAQLYSLTDNFEKLAINAIPDNFNQAVSIPLGYINEQGSELTITANNLVSLDNNLSIHLEDKHTDILHDLRASDVYNFTINATQDEERFVLHLARINASAQNLMADEHTIEIYTYGHALYINQTQKESVVVVYDLMGREIHRNELHNSGLHKINLSVATGTYMVSVVSESSVKTEKVFVQ